MVSLRCFCLVCGVQLVLLVGVVVFFLCVVVVSVLCGVVFEVLLLWCLVGRLNMSWNCGCCLVCSVQFGIVILLGVVCLSGLFCVVVVGVGFFCVVIGLFQCGRLVIVLGSFIILLLCSVCVCQLVWVVMLVIGLVVMLFCFLVLFV